MRGWAKRWAASVLALALTLGGALAVQAAPQLPPSRRVNAPYFSSGIGFSETAVFWFGRVTPSENYADVRVGYNANLLYVHVAVFDRLLWYNPYPASGDLTAWDSATLYLNLDGNAGNTLDRAFRFDGQLNWWEPRAQWQAAYHGSQSGWIAASNVFTTETFFRYESDTVGGVNNNLNNRGWAITFYVPFASLGLSGPPPQGTVWGLAVALHDRDQAPPASLLPDKTWPEDAALDTPATWGQLAFGLPAYTPQPAVPVGTVTVRHNLNGATVVDGAVGGGTACGDDLTNYWTAWGENKYKGSIYFNVQNQFDIADWPCFSKYYVTFPLDVLPAGKVVISATLMLHQFGNAGQGWTPGPQPSYIQVLTVGQAWDEDTLTWNTAPLAQENVAGAWVDPLPEYPGEPGVPRTWDVSRAVAEAYAAGGPLRLALYSADGAYHSGRYFWSSEHDDYKPEARPTLTIVWGEPLLAVHKTVWPITPTAGQQVTYALHLPGSGHPLTLTDNLPPQVSSPGPIRVEGGGDVTYDPGARRVGWKGTLATGQFVTLTFPVTVMVSGPVVVYNMAVLTDAMGRVSTDTAVLIIDARQTWLPLVLRK